MAVRSLLHSRSALALEALLDVVSTGKSLLGRMRVADPSPEVLAALQILAASWGQKPRVQEILRAARKSKDSEIRSAVSLTGEDE
jgi:hypothetical protein